MRFGACSATAFSFGVPSIAPPRSVNRGRFERNRPSSLPPMRSAIEDRRARGEALVLISIEDVFFVFALRNSASSGILGCWKMEAGLVSGIAPSAFPW
jgi:hypothetical protein